MPYHLCIDGGGTKTLALLAHVSAKGTTITRGEAGPSNLTFGLEGCLAATRAAVSAAVSAMNAMSPGAEITFPSKNTPFSHVWAAYAGCARAGDRAALRPPLTALLGPLRLTGDGELLTAPMVGSALPACVTLICGTGSLALRWARAPQLVQVGRSGGWGPLLGDEGSGWALGKAAVRCVLDAAANGRPILDWHREVLAHFGLCAPDRLIATACALDAGLAPAEADSERKTRIAACSRMVVASAEAGVPDALGAVRRVAGEVVENIAPLVDVDGNVADTMLVVAGGLGQVDVFWREVEALFVQRGWEWGAVVKMPEPARSGLDALLIE